MNAVADEAAPNPAIALLPADHPQRRLAADEVHARPHESLTPPLRATYLAICVEPALRDRELAHIRRLCESFDAESPALDAIHFRTSLGPLRFKWERHTEFSAYTFIVPGLSSQPFAEPASTYLPAGWVAAIPGTTIVAAHAKLIPDADSAVADADLMTLHFEGNAPVGARIGDGAGSTFADFRIHADGHTRFIVRDRGLTPRQAGRTLQRLFEIEAYRVMALLALPVARRLVPDIAEIEEALGQLTGSIAGESSRDETLLGKLTKLAADVEHLRNATSMRLGAGQAYHALVVTRIAELRESRLPGFQTIEEFMTHRLAPAMATCAAAAQRLRDLSERVAHTSSLLSARVEIVRERQNQALLASMDRRARHQLQLQRTVEWLSVAAVTYYAAGLAGFVSKAFRALGYAVDPDLVVGAAVPLFALLAASVLRRARRESARSSGE